MDNKITTATALFKSGESSLVHSAKLAKMTLSEFITHASRSGIPVISLTDDEVKGDMDTLDQWLRPDLFK